MIYDRIDDFQIDMSGGSDLGLTLVLALMMFTVALSLRLSHFEFLKTQPRIYLGGVAAQIIGLPALTVLICFALNIHASLALGMIIVACCPGGNVSNLISLFARGNTALSVSLTATSSLFAAFLTPVSILFWCGLYGPTRALLSEIDIDPAQFLIQVLIILAIPLLLGMVTAKFLPKFAARVQGPLSAICGVALLAIIVIVTVSLREYIVSLWDALPLLIGLIALHNGLAFLLGNLTARAVRADTPSRRAMTIEVGIQNSGLGLVIIVTQLGGIGGATLVVALWGIWHLIAGSLLAGVWRWRDRKAAQHV